MSAPLDIEAIDALVARAQAAQGHAYAPYSGFAVGAAIAAGGRIFEGANVENASYPLCTCAERVAAVAAAYAGARAIDAIAVCTSTSPPASPCGACRQILLELAPDPAAVRVIAVNPAGERREWTLAALIPDGFTGRELP
jgi:cytidine deaminase